MIKRIAAIVVATGLAVCVADAARAAEPFAKVGFYGAAWLQFPIGIRNIGMGATGTSDVSGLATGYFNPASTAWVDATSVTGSHESFDESGLEITLSEFQITSPIPFKSASAGSAWRFTGGLSYTRLGMAPQAIRTIFLPDGTGETYDPDSWMLSALAGSQWSHGNMSLGGGVSAKYITEKLGEEVTTWSFDLGLIASYSIPVRGGLIRPRAGYAALNLDNGGTFDGREYTIATEYRGGFGLDFDARPVSWFGRSVPVVSLSLDHDRIDDENDSYSTGADYASGGELSIVGLVHVRYGELDDAYTMYGAGIGWDWGQVLFRLDYAHSRPEDEFYRDVVDFERDTLGAQVGVRW